jgi:peroxin-5
VNESLDLGALTVLHQFLEISAPSLAGPRPSRSDIDSMAGPWSLHQRLTEQYLAVAREQYRERGEVDPDVQVGLGTLYYMMGEYDEARGCWVNALGERPDVRHTRGNGSLARLISRTTCCGTASVRLWQTVAIRRKQ